MNKLKVLVLFLFSCFIFFPPKIFSQNTKEHTSLSKVRIHKAQEKYDNMQRFVAKGWNTWDTRSVLRHVLLPYGIAIDISLESANGEKMSQFLIGERKKGAPTMRPGAHTYDGSYTNISTLWNGFHLKVESASKGQSNTIIITPQKGNTNEGKVIISFLGLWNRASHVTIKDNNFTLGSIADNLNIKGKVFGELLKSTNKEMIFSSKEPIIISCGDIQTPSFAKKYVQQHFNDFTTSNKKKFGKCYDEYNAMQNILGWNNIYDPTINKVITPVSRIWNIGWSNNPSLGGFVLFCWDTYFASMMCSLDCKELAYANATEITRGITEAGFVPNFYTESNYKSRDRSQPPVGSLAAWTIYQRHKEKWFLELLYTDLLRWNRWWDKNRKTDGLLCWGSSPYEPITYRYWEFQGVNETFGGALESGLDNSHMYDNIPFNKQTHQQQLNDVGLNGLYVMDCNILAKIAEELNLPNDVKELQERAKTYSNNLSKLWDEENSFYYNYRTDIKQFNRRISPTNFYPLLANVPTNKQAEGMITKHLLNTDEFWGDWIIPVTPRNDPAFKDNSYWRGRIWAPLNFLVYMGLRNYDTKIINKTRKDFAIKSKDLLLKSWLSNRYIFENYNAITGEGDDVRNSDKFYHWGALLGLINLMEEGFYF